MKIGAGTPNDERISNHRRTNHLNRPGGAESGAAYCLTSDVLSIGATTRPEKRALSASCFIADEGE